MSQPRDCPGKSKRATLCVKIEAVLKLVLITKSSKWFENHSGLDLRTNLGDHGNHGTQRLLSVGVIHYHLLTKVTEKLATKQNHINMNIRN